MKSKIFVLLTCLCMVFVFVGCGDSADTSESTEAAEPAQAVYYEEIAALPTIDSTVEGISESGRTESMSSSSSSVSIGGGIESSVDSEVSSSGSITIDGEEVSSFSDSSSSSSGASAESSSSGISVSYSYRIEAANADDAKALLQNYYDYVTGEGLAAEEQDDGSVVIKNGDVSLAKVTFSENDSSYSAKLEMMTIDQAYVDKAMEELTSDDEEDSE